MTLPPSSNPTRPSKQMPIRAMKSAKYCSGSGTRERVPMPCDSLLQSPTSNRKYLRRGSRSPSMILLPDFSRYATTFDDTNDDERPQHHQLPITKAQPERTLSVMSMLRLQLQAAAVQGSESDSFQYQVALMNRR